MATTMKSMEKTHLIGHVDAADLYRGYGFDLAVKIDVELRKKEDGKLVFAASGDIQRDSCGQNLNTIFKLAMDNKIKFSKGWNIFKLARLIEIWELYHLNDMHAECPHQAALMSTIKKVKGKDFFSSSNYEKVIELPEFKSCPECGYKYGSAWLYVALPAVVVKEVRDKYL
jgi:hypothetical protein